MEAFILKKLQTTQGKTPLKAACVCETEAIFIKITTHLWHFQIISVGISSHEFMVHTFYSYEYTTKPTNNTPNS